VTWLYASAINILGAGRAVVSVALMPIFSVAFAIPLLHEWPTRLEFAGLSPVFVGIATALKVVENTVRRPLLARSAGAVGASAMGSKDLPAVSRCFFALDQKVGPSDGKIRASWLRRCDRFAPASPSGSAWRRPTPATPDGDSTLSFRTGDLRIMAMIQSGDSPLLSRRRANCEPKTGCPRR